MMSLYSFLVSASIQSTTLKVTNEQFHYLPDDIYVTYFFLKTIIEFRDASVENSSISEENNIG